MLLLGQTTLCVDKRDEKPHQAHSALMQLDAKELTRLKLVHLSSALAGYVLATPKMQ